VWRSLKKLKVELPYDLAIPFLGRYLQECTSGHRRAACTSMFTAAVFTISKLWNWPRSPSTEEYERKCVIYTTEYYSAINKNEIMSFVGKWMELEHIT
jgi:hypothetical protein